MKTFYIAGRTAKVTEIKKLGTRLSELGYQNVFDWTAEKDYQPYEKNRQEASRFAQAAKDKILTADCFILLWDDNFYGALIELGIFLASSTATHRKKIYIVGPKERVCVFEMLPEFYTVNDDKALMEIIRQHTN